MHYTVTWNSDAETELARIWMNASSRDAVTKAADEIDRCLAVEPLRSAEDFYGDWQLICLPLGVVFTIHEDDRRVEILQVCLTRSRRSFGTEADSPFGERRGLQELLGRTTWLV
jgi:hypothetical protein